MLIHIPRLPQFSNWRQGVIFRLIHIIFLSFIWITYTILGYEGVQLIHMIFVWIFCFDEAVPLAPSWPP